MALKLGAKISKFTRDNIERELYRFEADDYLWHRHISGVDLRPHQRVYSKELEENSTNLLIASRRLGKSFAVAAKFLKIAATCPNSEINIHSPALEQSKRNLRYMIDMVLNSEILTAMIEKKLGEGIGKEYIEFWNGSSIQAKGQASSVDGLGATGQWWEEVDDLDPNILFERIYPTGSMIKPGYNYGKYGQCLRIATGTIKGKGNIYNFENPEKGVNIGFHTLPKYNVWHGVRWGIIPKHDVLVARDVLMTPEQFARAYLVLYTESSNFFQSKVVDRCQDAFCEPISIQKYMKKNQTSVYKRAGRISIGIDCGAQGTGEHPSKWSATFFEDQGFGTIRWLYAQDWDATANPDDVLNDLANLIAFFRPNRGMGDAFDTTFLHNLNKICHQRGLTSIDVKQFHNKQGTGGWDDWFISPVRFIGPNKHKFYSNLRLMFYQRRIKLPYVVKDHEDYVELEKYRNQLENIKKEDARLGYDTYSMVRDAIGDDHVDSSVISAYCLETLKGTVRPIGMAIDSFGSSFAEPNFASAPTFGYNSSFADRFKSKKADSVKDFLMSDDDD